MIKKEHIPNILTIGRIAIVPFYIWLTFFVHTNTAMIEAFVLFVIASYTDYLDGMIARKYNVISNFGKIMDPLADKILVISALVALAHPVIGYINYYIVGIIVLRELVVTILREVYMRKKIYIAANMWGKVKTVMQMVGIIFALFYKSILSTFIHANTDATIVKVLLIYFWITAAVTLISGANYFFIKKRKK